MIRFHLPVYETIVLELEEDGYQKSVVYLRKLLELDEIMWKETDSGTLIWRIPRLKDNKDALLRLKEGLIVFEKAKNIGALFNEE